MTGRALWMASAAVALTIGYARGAHAQSSPARDILVALKDSILRGGTITRAVIPPRRSHQRPPRNDALPALAALLGLSAPQAGGVTPSCSWAPVEGTAVRMDITVTEFTVVGDTARVSILRHCQARQRGRITGFESEPTWILHRENGRWVVVRTSMRVTAHPARLIQPVG